MSLHEKLKGTPLADFDPRKKNKVEELEIIDTVVGDGQEVVDGDTITAHYTGALVTDGSIFESSRDSGNPATFGLHQVIDGWTVGVPGMKIGGTRRLVIPAQMAYGQRRASAQIGPNSDLVFDIELIAIR
ncbi:FKBP-type peptidyl-prolyl cis-trans isomerase [Candidatus Saccharibacteria bacterium]|nr:FKBP-type peptidyl-prolyl cis-trans isomerase [Candidatus Saccharibacteria bacterium]